MKRLTLTFDNGPSPEVTDHVLDVLTERGIRTTFFVCGKDISTSPQRELLRRAQEAGHHIGNHTFSHAVELGATDDPDAPQAEIARAQEVLGEFAREDRLFRPSGGGGVIGPRLLSRRAVEHLCDGKYTCVLWNCVPRDWEDAEGWPERAMQDVARLDWTLVVLHDVASGAMNKLEHFLDLATRADVEIVQPFPADCVPIHRGEIVGPIDNIVAREAASFA